MQALGIAQCWEQGRLVQIGEGVITYRRLSLTAFLLWLAMWPPFLQLRVFLLKAVWKTHPFGRVWSERFTLSLYSRLCLHVTSSRTFLATLFKYHTHLFTRSLKIVNLLFLLKILSIPYVISGVSIQLKSAPQKCPFSQRSDLKIQGF